MNNAEHHLILGGHLLAHSPSRAAEAFRAALAADPDSVDAHASLATALGKTTSEPFATVAGVSRDKQAILAEALAHADRALALDPESYHANVSRAAIKARQSSWVEAFDHLKKAASLAPENGHLYASMASCAIELRHGKEAEALARNACANCPTDAGCFAVLARALKCLGKDEEALVALETARSLDPENSEVYETMGAWQMYEGHVPQSVQNHLEALRIDPVNRVAQRNVELATLANAPWQKLYWSWNLWLGRQQQSVQALVNKCLYGSLLVSFFLIVDESDARRLAPDVVPPKAFVWAVFVLAGTFVVYLALVRHLMNAKAIGLKSNRKYAFERELLVPFLGVIAVFVIKYFFFR